MSRKDTVNSLFMTKLGAPNPAPVDRDKDRVRSGAVSAMGSSLQHLSDGARNAARLEDQIAQGQHVIEIDPAEIDGSMVRDRLAAAHDPGFEDLVQSIEVSGQQVPILVRPHPTVPGRYQVAYGHRRLQALARLNRPVKAIVRVLTDAELVVAQGKENLDRQDLSYIEKALFARRLEDMGFERSTIMAALSTDKADLSRYIAVARLIPEELLADIGPARKVGRARWMALSERLAVPTAPRLLTEVRSGPAFAAADSDARFQLVFSALEPRAAIVPPRIKYWKTPRGQNGGRLEFRADSTVLTVDEKRSPRFGAFLADRLDALYAQYLEAEAGEGETLKTD